MPALGGGDTPILLPGDADRIDKDGDDLVIRDSGDSVILRWDEVENEWVVPDDLDVEGSLSGVPHSDLESIGADDHHSEDHATRHHQGGADEIDAADLSGASGTSGQVLETDGTDVSWADIDESRWEEDSDTLQPSDGTLDLGVNGNSLVHISEVTGAVASILNLTGDGIDIEPNSVANGEGFDVTVTAGETTDDLERGGDLIISGGTGDLPGDVVIGKGDLTHDDLNTIYNTSQGRIGQNIVQTASIQDGDVTNDKLDNDAVIVAGNPVSLGGTTDIDHNDLSTIGSDDHHDEDHATRHHSGEVDEIDAGDLAGGSGTDGQVLETDGTSASWTDLDASQWEEDNGTLEPKDDTIDLGVNNQDIVNVGEVDGVTVSNHSNRHSQGGADEIDVASLAGDSGDSGQLLQTDGSDLEWADPYSDSDAVDAVESEDPLELAGAVSMEKALTMEPSSEPDTPDTDDIALWNDGAALKCKFSDGSVGTIISLT